jgi:hypothetical protein
LQRQQLGIAPHIDIMMMLDQPAYTFGAAHVARFMRPKRRMFDDELKRPPPALTTRTPFAINLPW